MNFKITNVKVSLKTTPISLNNVLNLPFQTNNHRNFIVVKAKYTYSIFKTNKMLENHINITKIPKIKKVKKAIKYLKKYLNFEVKNITIDNIIATFKIDHKIDLVSVCEEKLFKTMKYNSEKFPGLYVKFEEGTAILFHSGSIVIVGCKNEKDIECLMLNISAAIK